MSLNQDKQGKLIRLNYDFITGLDDTKQCYSLSPKTVHSLLALIPPLHWKTRWHSEQGTAIVQDVISEIADNAIKELILTGECETPNCQTYDPSSVKVEWQPHNPFTDPDYTSPSYGVPPWVVIDSPTITGLLQGDVITDLTRAMGTLTPIYALPATLLDLFNTGLPRFRITCGDGDGVVKITLLNILAGGRAIIVHDDDILGNGAIVELNMDTIAVPPETQTGIVIEREITGSGSHHIDVIFIPAFDEQLPFIFYGGGLRKFELCGFSQEETMCCNSQTELLQNILITQNQLGALQLESMDDGTPTSIAPNAPASWDGSPLDDDAAQLQGYNALCAAIKSWIGFVLWEQARAIAAGASVFAALADHFLGHPDRVFTWIPFSIPEVVQTVTISALSGMINDTAAIDAVACCFKRGLRGYPMSPETLANALNSCDFEALSNEAQIAGIVDNWNNNPANYRAFLRHLTAQRANAPTVENGCQCCDDGFNWLFDYNFFEGVYPTYTPPSYTRIAENRIEITTFFGNDSLTNPDDAQRGFRVYAPENCCFAVRVVSPSIPFIPPAPNGYNIIWMARGGEPCYNVGTGVDLSVSWCTDNFEMRWGATTLAHPFTPTDQKIVLEFSGAGC